jgi:hypothetical protein
VVSFGIGSLLIHQSFPRRRESSPSAAYFQWLAEWIPAFAGMTVPMSVRVSQMTPLPNSLRGTGLCLLPLFLRWPPCLKTLVMGTEKVYTTCEYVARGKSPATPSPGPPRLKKAPGAAHPLPYGGEGRS